MRRLSLTAWIFIGMAAGIALGLAAPQVGVKLAPLSNIFLRLIKSIIAPLIFGTLVYGIAGAGNLKTMGRIGLKAIVYFEIVTTVALFLGLAFVNLVRPGVGMKLEQTAADRALPQTSTSLAGVLEHTFPASIIDAMARGEVLQIVVFAFLFGAACAAVGEKARPVVEFAASLAEVMFRYTKYVMYLAPVGVGAAMAVTVGGQRLPGAGGLGQAGAHDVRGAGHLRDRGAGRGDRAGRAFPCGRFIAAVREPFLIAFSTASSEAALPARARKHGALRRAQAHCGVRHPHRLQLQPGRQHAVPVAGQRVRGAGRGRRDDASAQQLLMMLTLMLTSKGVAGVPRASLVILAGTLATFNLPLEGVAVLLGIDAAMDMARTSVNVLGNCLATAVVAKWEGGA